MCRSAICAVSAVRVGINWDKFHASTLDSKIMFYIKIVGLSMI